MKRIFILVLGFLLITANLYAAGDLIVEGKVGIGTTTPATTLDVQGNITILAGSDIRPSANSTTAINIAQADGTDFVIFDTTNKKVGIGTIPTANLHIAYGSPSSAAGNYDGITAITRDVGTNTHKAGMFIAEQANTNSFAGATMGLNALVKHYGTANLTSNNALTGGRYQVLKSTSGGTITSARGVGSIVSFNDTITGTITNAINYAAESIDAKDGIITNAYNFYGYQHIKDAGGTVTNAYGIWLKQQTVGATTNSGIVLDGDGAGSDIVFGPTQNVRLYSKSDNKLYANDGINETQVSPHDPVTNEWIFYSKNVKTGRVVRVDMEKLVKAVEKLTGEKFMVEAME